MSFGNFVSQSMFIVHVLILHVCQLVVSGDRHRVDTNQRSRRAPQLLDGSFHSALTLSVPTLLLLGVLIRELGKCDTE